MYCTELGSFRLAVKKLKLELEVIVVVMQKTNDCE